MSSHNVGDPAPSLRGTAAGGQRVELERFRPSSVVVEFLRGTW